MVMRVGWTRRERLSVSAVCHMGLGVCVSHEHSRNETYGVVRSPVAQPK